MAKQVGMARVRGRMIGDGVRRDYGTKNRPGRTEYTRGNNYLARLRERRKQQTS